MTEGRFLCEDCGYRFEEADLDIEESPLACPRCGGLDIQRLDEDRPQGPVQSGASAD